VVVIGILNRGANNANEGVACVPGMLPGMADKSELDLGDASLGLPRLPEVPEVAAITAGSSPPPSERDSQADEAVCCICLQAELDPLAWRAAPAMPPQFNETTYQRPLSATVGQPIADDGELVSPCGCKGSAALKHVGCVRLWHAQLNHPSRPHCHTCLQPYTGKVALALAHDNRCKLMTDARDDKEHNTHSVRNSDVMDQNARRRRLADAQLTITRSLLDEGDLEEAMRLARETLVFTWNAEKATVLQLLAVAHDRKGEAQAALQCHERAHSIRVRCQGSKHHETAMSLSRTGVALLAAGNPAEARKMTKKAVRMIERCKDSSEAAAMNLAAAVNNLATVLRYHGDDQKAELLHWRALRTYEWMEQRAHPQALRVLNNLTHTLMRQRRFTEAAECSSECMQAAHEGAPSARRVDGADRCHYLGTRGVLRKAMGDTEEGNADLDTALQGLRELGFSESHQWCATFAAKRRLDALDDLVPPPPSPGSLTHRTRWLSLTLGCASMSNVTCMG